MTARLDEPGAILLVSCYELGHAPHGVAMPAGFLRREGYRPACVDLSVQDLADETLDAAKLAVISVPMRTALRLGAEVAQRVRERNPDCRIAFSGMYALMNAGYLRDLGARHVLAGESEAALVELCRTLERGKEPPAEVRGLEKLPFAMPSRDGLPALSEYARLIDADRRRRVVGYVEATRGCLDTCRHCPVPAIYGGRFFVVPKEIVVEDAAAQIEAGAEHITFGDPDFLNGPGHGLAVLAELHRRFPEVTFDVTAQVTHLLRKPELPSRLAELGCAFVVSAFESLSDRVLSHLRKQHRRAQIEELCARARDGGLELRPTFVPFTPWTELADMRELVDFVAERDLVANVDPIQLTVRLLVPPGSLLLEAEESRDAFGDLDPEALTHQWAHEDPRVDELQAELAARVERAADTGEEPAETLSAMRRVIYAACGLDAPGDVAAPTRSVARMTEPWFCCSEPTAKQMRVISRSEV